MSKQVEEMFNVGAHYGYSKSRRHPSVSKYIFGVKNGVEIFDLEKTQELLDNAKKFVEEIASDSKQILFVVGKRQAVRVVKENAEKIDQPYVVGRFIGGTITNFEEISKRVKRLEDLTTQKEKGLLAKYTKKERLLIDREIEKLEDRFGGIINMKKKPAAFFIIDPDQEEIALKEGIKEGIPVISLCGSDCNISRVNYPIVANDSSIESIEYFVKEICDAYTEGAKKKKNTVESK